MAIQLFTDSSSDLSPADAARLNVHVVPLNILFGETSYRAGVDLTTQAFYEKLANADALPKTSQPSPASMADAFSPFLERGDDIVVLTLSADMSGTYRSAQLAAELLHTDRIWAVDSRTVTFGLGLLVMAACELRRQGLGAAQLAAELERLKARAVLYAVIGNLKFLQMGGRLRSSAALLGTMLQIKPIITIRDGLVEVIDKQRGQKNAFDAIVRLTAQTGVDSALPACFGHTNDPSLAQALRAHMAAALPDASLDSLPMFEIGPSVGVHAGPGAAGFGFFQK